MGKQDCAFQYALGNGHIVEDTDLITLEEAKELWNKYLPDFKEKMRDGREPEMAIWVDMKHPHNYHNELYHIHANDVELWGETLFKITRERVTELDPTNKTKEVNDER